MIETAFWFGDTRVTKLSRAQTLMPEALIMFHGFPGQYPAAEIEKHKNDPRMRVEAAKALAAARDLDVYLPSYEGLGESRGKFSFYRSVTRSVDLASDLAARGYGKVHVAGHSWGAFVAFNVHRSLGAKAGRLALLAGLLDIKDEQQARDFLPEYIKDYPEIMGSDAGALERAALDLNKTRLAFNPMALAVRLPQENLLIVHGRPDAAVGVGISRRFHEKAGGRYIEIEDDHGFTRDMKAILAEIVGFFSS
jgi:pimeloyl-ACP methyl ester carboxylesterase